MKPVFAAVFALALGAPLYAGELVAPEGRVLLTVGGAVASSNAPALKPEAVNVAGFLGVESEKALAFDDLMLAGMPQFEISATLLDTGKDMTYSGPRLSDLLTAAGAEGKTAAPMALDGYSAELTWETITQYQPILATHADGKPLAIGKLGPAMVVFPKVEDQDVYETFSAMEVFATFYIGVE